ncbi:MAG TPA: MerR family transcriptional regulator [Actinopolymorphaceae bacterium]|jgi:DNA-binding transcriptional MerR regulator
MSTYRISQLAARTGVPPTTLRYYESAGLLPADRSPAGYRLYGEQAVERLEFIKTAKKLGLSLEEIATLMSVWETSACVQVKAEIMPRLRARLREAEQQRSELAGLIDMLRAALDQLAALPDRSSRCNSECDILLQPTEDAGLGTGAGQAVGRDVDRDRWQDVPVACSLTPHGVAERVGQWRNVLAGATRAPIPNGLELTLPLQRIATIAELAAAEHACCPFLDFRLHLDGPHLRLQVRAPAEGRHMLAALFDAPTDPPTDHISRTHT